MKKLTLSILLLLLTLPILAQERKLEQVDGNLYSYKLYDGKQVTQTGYYKNIDGTLIVHGMWRNNLGTTALFDNGDLVWIKPKGQKKYTSEEIQLHRLKRKLKC